MKMNSGMFYEKTSEIDAAPWRIIRHYVDNPLRNYNYVLTNDKCAIAIDPLDVDFVRSTLKHYDVALSAILLTHEHSDHIDGVGQLASDFAGVPIYGPAGIERFLLKGLDGSIRSVRDGDDIGSDGGNIRVLATPGHTMMHLSYVVDGNTPILISGDTIFSLGVGHCKLGGDVEALFHTIYQLRRQFDDDRTLYLPGHDLLESNFGFSKQFGCRVAEGESQSEMRTELDQKPHQRSLRTISQECRQNLFFNANCRDVAKAVTGNPESDPMTVFISLRERRDQW